MASRRPLVLLAVVVGSLFRAAVGQRAKPLLPGGPSCSTADNYTDGSPYKRNLDELLAGLPAAAGGNVWFYNGTAGAPGTADQVFGLIMCYADRNATQCRECLAGAPAGITTACPGSRSVRAAYDACVLRYSPPPSFFSTADLDVNFFVRAIAFAVDPDKMLNACLTLMTDLTGRAASSPSRLANATTPYDGDPATPVHVRAGAVHQGPQRHRVRQVPCLGGRAAQEALHERDRRRGQGVTAGRYELGAFDITLPPSSPQPGGPSSTSSIRSRTALAVGLSVGSVALLLILGSLICLSLRRRRRRKEAKILEQEREQQLEEGSFFDGDDPAMEDDFEKGTGPKLV